MTRTVMCTTLAVILTVSLAAQDPRNASALLQAAQTKESIQNDLSGAILLYEQAVKAAGSDRVLAPRTLLALARAYEKAGREEARSTYQRIVNEYSESGAVATSARTRLAALQQSAAGLFKERILETDSPNATVSPDGTLSAYVSFRTGHGVAPDKRTGAIYVRNLSNGREKLVAPPRSADEVIPSPLTWSPDSQRISYQVLMGSRTREQRLVTVANGTVKVLPLAGPHVVFGSFWSPDAQRIVIATRPNGQSFFELQLIEPTAGSTALIGLSISDSSGIRWSADSSKFAYVPADKAVVRVMSNSG